MKLRHLSADLLALPGAPSAFLVPLDGAPLAGMTYPWGDVQWDVVHAYGVTSVLDLSGLPCGYDCTPLEHISVDLVDLSGGLVPDDQERERKQVRSAVSAIAAHRNDLHGVVVHCVGGRGRTGTVLGAYLVTLGFPTSTVTDWLNEVYESQGKRGWPESNWQSNLLEAYR